MILCNSAIWRIVQPCPRAIFQAFAEASFIVFNFGKSGHRGGQYGAYES